MRENYVIKALSMENSASPVYLLRRGMVFIPIKNKECYYDNISEAMAELPLVSSLHPEVWDLRIEKVK
jgi:hypothetical protein